MVHLRNQKRYSSAMEESSSTDDSSQPDKLRRVAIDESANDGALNAENDRNSVQRHNLPKILDEKFFKVVSFGANGHVIAKCTAIHSNSQKCNQSISGNLKSTGNFRSHYRLVHKEQFNELCNHTSKTKKPVEAATNIKQTAMPFCKRVPDSELRGAILDFIVARNLAFDIVNDVSFRKLLLLVSPNELNIPGTTAIMNELKTQYLRSKATLKELLKKIDYVCTTADVWTARGQSYIGVTVHYIDQDYVRKGFMLAFRRLTGKHTYDVLGKILYQINKEFELELKKLTHTITDGGSNLGKSFRTFGAISAFTMPTIPEEDRIDDEIDEQSDDEFERDTEIVVENVNLLNESDNDIGVEIINLDEPNRVSPLQNLLDESILNSTLTNFEIEEIKLPQQMRCFAHQFHLIASTDFDKNLKARKSDVYDALKLAMHKLNRFLVRQNRSSHAKTIVKSVCGRLFPVWNLTRWNSKYDTISKSVKAAQDIERAMKQMNIEMKSKSHLEYLTVFEWQLLNDYVKTMEPIAKGLLSVQGENYVTLGNVMPLLTSMKKRFETPFEYLLPTISSFMQKSVINSILKRFTNYMEFTTDNRDMIVAAVSNPRFKLAWIENENNKTFAKNLFLEECEQLQTPNLSPRNSAVVEF